MKWTLPALLDLLLLAVPAAVQAQSGDGYGYSINTNNTNTITITNYTGDGGVVTIPTNINNLLVTGIGTNAFENLTNLTSVTIPGSVTNIGDYAFDFCDSLTNVTISNGVTSIGDGAFENLTNLTSVTIPASVTSIGEGPFAYCISLTAIMMDPGNLFYSSVDGVLFDYSLTTLIQYPGGISGSYTIPGSVTSIGDYAFADCTGLASVTIPGSVTNIGDYAFDLCESLTNATIANGSPASEKMRSKCTGLTSVTIPDSVTSIGQSAFEDCTNLTSVTIPGSVTNIGASAFDNCTSLTSVTIPNSVTSIGASAFEGCNSLTSVTIPGSVTNIGASAFQGCIEDLTSVYFYGNAPTVSSNVFLLDSDATVYYLPGATGWSSSFAGLPAKLFFPPNQTWLQVTITPVAAITAGAQWRVDGGALQNSGTMDTNLPVGNHTVSFSTISGWTTPANQAVSVSTNSVATATGAYVVTSQTGSLQVLISPTAAIAAGAQWLLAGGTNQSGATTNLSPASYTVSFKPISEWNTPANQTVTITNGATTTAGGLYIPSTTPSNGLILLTNGYGTIQHGSWPKILAVGNKYRVTAAPKPGNVFSDWVVGTNQPNQACTVLNAPGYTFFMESNLVLEANFVTNVYLAAQGTYKGLFAPTNPAARQQTNSGSFAFNVTSSGAVSGNLSLGGQTVPFSGKFNLGGTATNIVLKREPSLTTTLQLDFADQSVSGAVSNSAFTAELNGDRDVFSSSRKATEFEGQYTLVIPGTSDSNAGPFGVSYGTVKVSALGTITLAGSLADGTAISQSSVVSKDGFWPLYVSLYGGKGSLWGWNYFNFTNHTITSAPVLSWINETNSSKTAVYRSGFTNQEATLNGGLYVSTNTLTNIWPADLTATLEGGGLLAAITNSVTIAANDRIAVTNSLDTNKLTLTVHKSTGVISGSFANPDGTKRTIKVNGVILQGETNAQGYFLGTNQSGRFTLDPP